MSVSFNSKVMSTAVDAVRDLLEQRLRSAGDSAGHSDSQAALIEPVGHQQEEKAALQVGLEELQVLWQELQDQVECLARERQRYADVFEYSPDACVVTDPHGVVREANHAAAELFGRELRHLAGKPLAALIGPAGQREFRRHLGELALDGAAARSWASEVCNGEERTIDVTLSMRGMGAPRSANGYCCVLRRRFGAAP